MKRFLHLYASLGAAGLHEFRLLFRIFYESSLVDRQINYCSKVSIDYSFENFHGARQQPDRAIFFAIRQVAFFQIGDVRAILPIVWCCISLIILLKKAASHTAKASLSALHVSLRQQSHQILLLYHMTSSSGLCISKTPGLARLVQKWQVPLVLAGR